MLLGKWKMLTSNRPIPNHHAILAVRELVMNFNAKGNKTEGSS